MWKEAKKSERPLPRPFQLPVNYSRIVQEGLKAGRLTGRARKKFLSTVAEAMHMHKLYPTAEEYDHVARRIVDKYSFMNQGSESGHVCLSQTNDKVLLSIQGYLVTALEGRLKYKRNYKGRPKPKQENEEGKTSKKPALHYPKAAVAVHTGPEDDNAAVLRHIKVMQAEYKKIHPNQQVISRGIHPLHNTSTKIQVITELMKRTFNYRRAGIVEGMPMPEILTNYIRLLNKSTR